MRHRVCGTLYWPHLWKVCQLWHCLGQLNEVLDFQHAAVLLVRHLTEVLSKFLGLVLTPHAVRYVASTSRTRVCNR